MLYTSWNPCAPTHGQKARRSPEKKFIITCRDISVLHPHSLSLFLSRERWPKLETWSVCDVGQRQVFYCAAFFPTFFLHSNGSQTVITSDCVSESFCAISSSLQISRSLSLSAACVSLFPRSLAR